ncbi:MAG: hypothetical protein A2W85_01685 [Bacteroidetes bacterium GWF2_41_31]|nr:MAG: hypothetical protein A2W85_01685 [Bacteroidetes bacterium GWF2_41_31]
MNMRNKKLKLKPKTKKPFDLYLLIFTTILVLPFVYSEKVLDPTLAPRLLGLGIIVGLLLLYNLLRPLKDRPSLNFLRLAIFPVFLGLIVWSVITIIPATTPVEGLFDIAKTLLTFFLLVLATQIFINNKNWIDVLTQGIVMSSIFATSIGIYQYFDTIPGKGNSDIFGALYEIKGLMAHKNHFAISLFLMLPFVIFGMINLKKWWKVLSIYSVVMIVLNILLLQTRSVWIATFIFSLALFFISTLVKKQLNFNLVTKKQAVIVTAGFLLVLFLGIYVVQKTGAYQTLKFKVSTIFDSDSHHNQGRLRIWESTLNLSEDHLIAGVGAGNWKLEIPPYFPYNYDLTYQNWRRPHNDYLWVLSEKGFLGLVMYLLLFMLIGFYYFKILRTENDKHKLIFASLVFSGIIGYLAIAFFDFPMERINHQVYIAIMMAAIIGIYYQNYPSKSPDHLNNQYFKIHAFAVILVSATLYYSWTLLQMERNIHQVIAYRNVSNWKKMIEYSDKAFNKLTPIDAFSSPIHLHMGEADLNMKNYKQAKKDLEIAFEYSPNNISVLNNLAIVSAELNNSKAAIDYLDYGLSIYPKYEASLFNKVNVYYRDKDYARAYVALLNCNTKNKRGDYETMMNVLTNLVNR